MNVEHPKLTARRRSSLTGIGLALGLCALALPASAQEPIVALEQHTERPVAEVFQADVTGLNTSLGGAINTGNTEAWQLNAGSAFDLVRGRHGLQLTMDFAYGRANVADDASDKMVDTVRNFRTKGRYDFFLTEMDALFAASAYRWDTFAGLDARVQGQLGYMRNVFKEENHRGWAELGYDLTYDNFDPDPLPDPTTMGAFLDGDMVVHSVRGFIGYENKLNASVTFVSGLEGLLNVEDLEDLRINWDNALNSSIADNFKLELKFTLQADTQPVPGAKKTDTRTTLNLIYTLI